VGITSSGRGGRLALAAAAMARCASAFAAWSDMHEKNKRLYMEGDVLKCPHASRDYGVVYDLCCLTLTLTLTLNLM
jgi:hypothetical protein